MVVALVFASIPAAAFPTLVAAAPNYQINYQGKLANTSGAAVADGGYDIVFRLYTVSSGGSAIWTESQTGANEVTVTNGLFSTMLGSVTSLASVDFNQTLYLGVTVEADSEMAPRKILGAVPAAFEADKLDGIDSTSFLRSDEPDTIASSSTSTLLTINQSGTGDILNLLDGGTEVFTVTDNGSVGIGTSSPTQKLHVAGGMRLTGAFYDADNSSGTDGYVLQTTSTTTRWVDPASLGLGGITSLGGLTVASQTFATSTSGGLDLSIVSAGSTHTFIAGLASGYTIPLTASTTQWDAAYASSTTFTDTYVRELFSHNVAGLTYSTSTGATTLTGGYTIPLSASTTDWNTAFGWGDHSAAGYLTGNETITLSGDVTGSGTTSITTTIADDVIAVANIADGDWGDFTIASNVATLDAGTVSDNEINYTDVTLNDFTFDVNDVSKTEFGYLNGVTSNIQTQLDSTLSTSTAASTYLSIAAWNATTTDALTEGSTNLYFTTARARESLSSTAPGLSYATSTGIFSLTGGYTIPLTASTTDWNTAYNTVTASSTFWDTAYSWGDHSAAGYLVASNNLSDLTSSSTARTNLGVDLAGTDNSTNVTLAGAYDYLSLSGQEITLNQLDLTTDVTGILPDANVADDITLTNITQITNRAISDTTGTLSVARGGTGATSLTGLLLGNGTSAFTATTTLSQNYGGTGLSSYTTGDILYADANGNLTKLGIGSTGQVLKVAAGLPSWGVDLTVGSGGGDGVWATTTEYIYPQNTSLRVLVGNSATSTVNSIFEVTGASYFSNNIGIGDTSPAALLTVGNGDLFQVNSSGAIAAATGITSSGTITLSGLAGGGFLKTDGSGVLSTSTIALASDVSGTLPVANGGTGATTLTGLLLGNGTSAFTATTTLASSYIEDAFLRNDGDDTTTGTLTAGGFTSAGTITYSGLAGGFLKTNGSGVLATSSIDISDDTNLAVGNGITLTDDTLTVTAAGGLSQAAGGLTTTGVLEDLNTLGAASTDGEFIVATGAGTFAYESGATARTSLGLGTGDSPSFTALTLSSLTGGFLRTNGSGVLSTSTIALASDVSGTLPVANGGTGATTLTGLLLGNGTSAFTATTTLSASYIEDAYLLNTGDTGTGDYAFNGTLTTTGTTTLATSGGYVGIGTTTNSGTLTIAETDGTALYIDQGNQTNTYALQIRNLGAGTSGIYLRDGGGSSYASLFVQSGSDLNSSYTNWGGYAQAVNGSGGGDATRGAFHYTTDASASGAFGSLMSLRPSASLSILEGQQSDGTSVFEIGYDGGGYFAGDTSIGTTTANARLSIQATSTNDIFNLFETGGEEVFTVLENGNVGIGTTSPDTKLQIHTSGTNNTQLSITTASQPGLFSVGDTDGVNALIEAGRNRNVFFRYGANSSFEGLFFQHDSGLGGSPTDVLSLMGDGNIGIGTTTPSNTLTVAGSVQFASTTDGFLLADSDGVLSASSTLASSYIQDAYLLNTGDTASGDYNFSSGTLFVDDSEGRVGIGTASPSSLLHVSGSSGDSLFTLAADTDNNDEDDNAGILFTQDGVNTTAYTGFVGEAFTTAAGDTITGALNNAFVLGTVGGDPQFNALQFITGDGAGTGVVQMTINTAGNVGIGTTTPSSKLTVGATAGSQFLVGDSGNATSTDFAITGLTNALLATNANGTVIATTSISASLIEDAYLLNTGDTTTGNIVFNDNVKALFGTGSDASIYYDGTDLHFDSQEVGSGDFVFNNGNVGIGTGTPESLLHIVSGNGLARGVKIDTDGEDTDIPFQIRTNSAGTNYVDSDTKFIVLGDGKVGIGTSTPGNQLSVYSPSVTAGIGSAVMNIQGATTVSSKYLFTVENSTDNVFAIDGAGNVGIGDTSPAALLTVGNGDLFQVNSSGAIAAATGITSSGTVTFSSLTGGFLKTDGSGVLSTSTIALASDVSGTLPVSNGGTGATTLTGLLLGNGTSAFTATTTLASSYIEDVFLRNDGDDTTTGTITAVSFIGALTGNADTASTLQTARTINGVSFDGSTNITITAASSTILSDWNTFTGSNTFTLAINANGGINVPSGEAYVLNGANVITADTSNTNYFLANSGNVSMSGTNNVSTGYEALLANTTGYNNAVHGNYALKSNTIGNFNTANGAGALFFNTSGSSNTADGASALGANTIGANNIAVGYLSGYYIADGATANQTSSSSLYLGASTKALVDGGENEIVIGYDAIGNGSNSVTLGNTDITKTILNGNVGIGTTTPANTLTVAGSVQFASTTDGFLLADSAGVLSASSTLASTYIEDAYVLNTGDSISGNLTFSGTAANIALGSNYISGDGDDEGIYVDGSGNVAVGGTSITPGISNTTAGAAILDSGTGVFSRDNGSALFLNTNNGSDVINFYQSGTSVAAIGTQNQQDIYISTAGTERLRITDSGEIGFNDSTPDFGFETVGTSTDGYFGISSIEANDGDIFIIDGDGNVGIGTTTPSAKLDIWGDLVVGTSSIPTLFADTANSVVSIGTTTSYATLTVAGNVWADAFTATSTTATSTFAGGLNVDNGAILHDYSSGLTTIQNLAFGALNFEADSGMVSWVDMPITSAAADGTVESYTAQLDGNALLTVYGLSDGSGGVDTLGIGIKDTTPDFSLEVVGTSTSGYFGISSAAADDGDIFVINNSGNVGIGTTTANARLTIQSTSTNDIFNLFETSGTEVFTVLESGNVGIGTTSPSSKLTVGATAGSQFLVGDSGNATSTSFAITNLTNALLATNANGTVISTTSISSSLIEDVFLRNDTDDTTTGILTAAGFTTTGTSTLATTTVSGRLGVGTTTPEALFTVGSGGGFTVNDSGALAATYATIQQAGASVYPGFKVSAYSTSGQPEFLLERARGTALGSPAAVQDGDTIGKFIGRVHNGTQLEDALEILFKVDGTDVTGAGGHPGGRIDFNVRGTSDTDQYGADGVTALTIRNTGNVGIGDTSPAYLLTVGDGDLFGVNSSGLIATESVASSSLAISNWQDGYVMQASTTAPGGFDWVATSTLGIGGSSTFLALTDTPSGYTDGAILFMSGSSVVEDKSQFYYDAASARLAIGHNSFTGVPSDTDLAIISTTTSSKARLTVINTDGTDVEGIFDARNDGTNTVQLGTVSTHPLSIFTGNGLRAVIGTTGGLRMTTLGNTLSDITNPGAEIDIEGDGGAIRFDTTGTSRGGFEFYESGSARMNLDYDPANDALVVRDEENTTDRVTFLQTGNVGIGTTTPGALLDIWGDIQAGQSATPAFYVDASRGDAGVGTNTPGQDIAGDTADPAGTVFHVKDTSSFAQLVVEGQSGGVVNWIDLGGASNDKIIQAIADGGELLFRSFNDDLGAAVNERILSIDINDGEVYAEDNFRVGGTAGIGRAPHASVRLQVQSSGTADILNLFETDGTEVFTVLENGNVGIGNTNPGYTLHVDAGSHAGEMVRFSNDDTTYGAQFTLDSSGGSGGAWTQVARGSVDSYGVYSHSAVDYLQWITTGGLAGIGNADWRNTAPAAVLEINQGGGGNDYLMVSSGVGTDGDVFIVDASGNVGIGTTSPQAELHIIGDFELGQGYVTRTITAYNAGRTNSGSIELYNLANGNMTFATDFSSGDIILSPGTTGGVGIGTTTANARLTVQTTGTTDILNLFETGGLQVLAVTEAGQITQGVGTVDVAGQNTFFDSIVVDNSAPSLRLRDGSADLIIDYDATTLSISTEATADAFVLLDDGNVGIGTTTPAKRLNVFDTVADAQFRLSYDDSRYADFQIDSTGDLFITASGDDVYLSDDNLWVCEGGSCPSITASSTAGYAIVENGVYFGNGMKIDQIAGTTTELGVYNASGSVIVIFDQ